MQIERKDEKQLSKYLQFRLSSVVGGLGNVSPISFPALATVDDEWKLGTMGLEGSAAAGNRDA